MTGTTSGQVCAFRLDGELFGVPLARVLEVVQELPVTRVPRAPAAVSGLGNLRGQIIPAIELRRCLALPARPIAQTPTHVVIETAECPVSFQVDEIVDILTVESADLEPPPDNLRGPARALIEGVYQLERELLLLLRVDATIAASITRADSDEHELGQPPEGRDHGV